ncbi:TPA: insecticidal delta-endotoxin Cry8Ea1 family protein [Bacillus thuringiensis]
MRDEKMNSNQNKNEYEVLNTSGNNVNTLTKYPFANDPDSSVLSSCQRSGPGNWINILGNAVSQAVSNSQDILSLLRQPSLSGIISMAFSLLNRMTGSNGRSISELSMCDLLAIIDLRVNQSVLDAGVADFNGSLVVYRNYLEALQRWNNNPNSATAEDVRARFRNSDTTFDFILTRGSLTNGGSLARNNAQILLLPSFANAAYFHLLLLRDANVYGDNWGLFRDTPNINYKSKLLDLIKLYTNYCTHWYNQGLNELRNRGNNATAWLEFHRFRRDMTLMVLDIVASFSNFDITRYPRATDIQLSRVIYTDPIGFVNRSDPSAGRTWFSFHNQANFSALESGIPIPSFSQFLDSMRISTGPLSLPASPNIHRAGVWYGNQNNFNGSSSQTFGEVTNENQTISGLNIFRIDSQAVNLNNTTFGVSRSEFYHDTSQGSQRSIYQGFVDTSGTSTAVAQNIQTFFPGENSNIPTPHDYTHILSRSTNLTGGLRQVASGRRSSLVLHGWTHTSLSRQNRVEPNRITQVPAVKVSTDSNCTVIAGPGFTGGDVVRMNSNGSVSYNITPANQQVVIRLRYACQGIASLRMTFGNGSSQVIPLVSTTSSINNLQYENFSFVTGPNSVNFLSAGTSVTIQNISTNSNVVLDRIELVPELPEPPIIPGEYQIVTAINNSSVLDLNSGTRVTLWSNSRGAHQIWSFMYDHQRNAYVIRNVSNPSLVLTWDFTSSNNIVFAAPFSPGRDEQYWIAENFQNGFVLGNLRNPNMVLDVSGGSTSNGTNIIAYPRHNGNAQRFFIRRP